MILTLLMMHLQGNLALRLGKLLDALDDLGRVSACPNVQTDHLLGVLTTYHGLGIVVSSFHEKVRLDLLDEIQRSGLVKQDHFIHSPQRFQNFGALALRDDWIASLDFPEAEIGVEANYESVTHESGCLKIADVAYM